MLRLTLTLCLFFPCYAVRAGMILDGVADSLYTTHATLFPAVGKVGSASGTLIAPNWVMTAAHILDRDFENFTLGGTTYGVAEFVRHPQFRINELGHGYDIALLRLSNSVVGIAPARIYTGSSEFGAVLSMAGFGATGVGSNGVAANPGTFRAGTNDLDAIISGGDSGGQQGAQNAILITDFDPLPAFDPLGTLNTIGSPTPTALEYHLAAGDSGGGAFIQANGEWFVAGIHSGVASQFEATGSGSDLRFGYGAVSFMTRVSSYQSFIASVSGVPEPSSMLLIATCALGMAGFSLRSRSAKSS